MNQSQQHRQQIHKVFLKKRLRGILMGRITEQKSMLYPLSHEDQTEPHIWLQLFHSQGMSVDTNSARYWLSLSSRLEYALRQFRMWLWLTPWSSHSMAEYKRLLITARVPILQPTFWPKIGGILSLSFILSNNSIAGTLDFHCCLVAGGFLYCWKKDLVKRPTPIPPVIHHCW